MCGIAGLVRFDGGALAERTRERARAMRAALRHRGPDGEGEAALADAILEHTRLALLDRAGGAQPMSTPDGRYTIVYNGEVYNHEELRARLAYPFRTRSDAETVLAAFVAWGPECVHAFNGMFSFFVWDGAARRGFAARDPLGVKPLAYAWDGVEFAFASEAHVVARAREVPVRAHVGAVLEVLVAPCFSGVERPMFDGVEYLPPGHWLELGPEGAGVAPLLSLHGRRRGPGAGRRRPEGAARAGGATGLPRGRARSAYFSAAASTRRRSRRSPRRLCQRRRGPSRSRSRAWRDMIMRGRRSSCRTTCRTPSSRRGRSARR
jgi:asparagine synthetase B (glutamine-hydrolysing)